MRYRIYHPQPCMEVIYEDRKIQYVPVQSDVNDDDFSLLGRYETVIHQRIGLWGRMNFDGTGRIIFSLWEVTNINPNNGGQRG